MTATLPRPVTTAADLVQPAMRRAVDTLNPSIRNVVSYHLGWVDQAGNPTTKGGGKALRPALALLSAQAAGGTAEQGVPGAVAVQFVHDFSLLHDDVMDGDVERRHRPTAWKLFGVPAAILAGDALLTLAVEVLQPAASPAATDAVTLAVQDLIAGQSKDLEFERRRDVTLHECVDMANGKTSALMRCAASIGAILAGASAERVDLLARFGMHLGLAFQLVDDLLGICGAPEVTGKAVLADLKVRKKSLPVVAALTSGTAAGDELAARYLVEGVPDDEELPEFARLIEQAGGLAWAEAEADRQVRAAGECVDAVGAPSDIREALWQITHFVTERDR